MLARAALSTYLRSILSQLAGTPRSGILPSPFIPRPVCQAGSTSPSYPLPAYPLFSYQGPFAYVYCRVSTTSLSRHIYAAPSATTTTATTGGIYLPSFARTPASPLTSSCLFPSVTSSYHPPRHAAFSRCFYHTFLCKARMTPRICYLCVLWFRQVFKTKQNKTGKAGGKED